MRKRIRAPSVILAVLFLLGLGMLIVPPVLELTSYKADDDVYRVITEQVRPPGASMPDAVSAAYATLFPAAAAGTEHAIPAGNLELNVVPTIAPTVRLSAAQSTLPPSQIDLLACADQNEDFVAWLNIPGTVIDYPVVQSDDTAYYLHHLFSGKESKLGCLFSLTSSDYETPSRNIAIYGHHLSNSSAMFSMLTNYKQASYYPDHSLIRLDSIYGTRTYRIFAVVNMKVSDWDAATTSFSSDADFLRFVNRAKEKSLYDIGVEVEETDNILTLITCDRSYGGASGRLIVMAVQEQ